MRTALDARAWRRSAVVLVVVALAYVMFSAFTHAPTTSHVSTAAGADTNVAVTAADTEGDDAVDPSAGPTETAPVPNASGTNQLAQNILNGLVFGLLLALASVGLSLIYGTTGLSNFAHGEQVSLGALLTFFFAT